MSKFIYIGDFVVNTSAIEWIRIDRCSPWGEVKLSGRDSFAIGDGSYAGCTRHIQHSVCRKPNGDPDYGWKYTREALKSDD